MIQLYSDEAFFARAVAEFLTTGMSDGAGAVVIATAPHVRAIGAQLAGWGLDVRAATERNQIVVADAHAMLAAFMVDGMPDRGKFFAAISPVLDRVRLAGYRDVRAFREMVDLLWDHNLPATVALETLWNEVLADRRVSLLCSYRVEDYDRLEAAVTRAYEDVFGALGGPKLLRQQIVAAHAPASAMPSAQTALVALRGLSGDIADEVLTRAGHYYNALKSPA